MSKKGFQPGNKLGGRPKAGHTILAEKMRERYINRAYEIADDLFEAQKELALGAKLQDSETEVVYRKLPDSSAIKDMLDRSQGKPKESLEVNNPGELEAIKESNKLIKQLIDDAKGS